MIQNGLIQKGKKKPSEEIDRIQMQCFSLWSQIQAITCLANDTQTTVWMKQWEIYFKAAAAKGKSRINLANAVADAFGKITVKNE